MTLLSSARWTPMSTMTILRLSKSLSDLAEQGSANLSLMGIEPTYPSEKYGYIIPESADAVSPVQDFQGEA